MGSLETVAVLFTDLVGSTALSSQLGPVAADELRRERHGRGRRGRRESEQREGDRGRGLARYFDRTPGTGTKWRYGRLNACRAQAAGATLCPPKAIVDGLPKMTPSDARRHARTALKEKFGKRFSKGHDVKVKCERRSPKKFRCAVKWVKGDYRYRGSMTLAYVRRTGTLRTSTTTNVDRYAR